MNSRCIIALVYKIVQHDRVDYSKAAPVSIKEEKFRVQIEGNKVRFNLNERFLTVDSARDSVKEFIEAWEISEGLHRNTDCFKLKFLYSIDDSPIKELCPVQFSFRVSEASVTLSVPHFPSAPKGLRVDPKVSFMYHRYMYYRQNRDTLLNVANLCEGVLRKKFKNRKMAASKMFVDYDFLKKIGYLAANKGGKLEARKVAGADNELTKEERHFLEEATRQLILRYAEVLTSPNKVFELIDESSIVLSRD